MTPTWKQPRRWQDCRVDQNVRIRWPEPGEKGQWRIGWRHGKLVVVTTAYVVAEINPDKTSMVLGARDQFEVET